MPRAWSVALAILALALIGSIPAPSAAAASPCKPTWTTVALPTSYGRLYDVSARASDDVWAVGHTGSIHGHDPLALHWDGSAWTVVPPVRPANAIHVELWGVAAVSEREAWAVGRSYHRDIDNQVLIQRWSADTGAWSIVERPYVQGVLFDVVARSPSDVWAVGYGVIGGRNQALAEHWDGHEWSVVPTPPTDSFALFRGVTAAGPRDLLAVGSANGQPLIERWDGTAWQRAGHPAASSSGELYSVAATPSGKAWAVGALWSSTSALFEHWDGTGWDTVPGDLPHSPAWSPLRYGVAAVGDGDAWATGQDPNFAHWDGKRWSKFPVRHWGGVSTNVWSVTATPSGDLWAVSSRGLDSQTVRPQAGRLCPVRVTAGGFTPSATSVLQGSGIAWSFPKTNTSEHTVADGSGMGLFDSGARAPGSSFATTLIGAGTYTVTDPTTSHTSSIKVPMIISPISGTSTTEFTITWASETARPGYVYDVQFKRPSATWYTLWRTGTTDASARFLPKAGPGTYTFRARLRNTANGRSSAWSPPKRITVG